MARVMTIDDYPLYAQMVADMISEERGHDVKIALNPIVPAEVLSFAPDVLVITLVRKLEALGHGPLHDFYTEVDGARALRALLQEIGDRLPPIILTSIGVKESEVPQNLPYISFVHIPQEVDLLLLSIDKVVQAGAQGDRPAES